MTASEASANFSLPWDQSNPGLILILVDQSSSMEEAVGDQSKALIAATMINRTIEDSIERCRRGASVLDKAHIGVVGYGADIKYELVGSLSDLNDSYKRIEPESVFVGGSSARSSVTVSRKVWLEPRHNNSTPMAEALSLAATKLEEWLLHYPDAPAPVVINVTDGAPNDLQKGEGAETIAAATRVRHGGASFERCLLLSVHIGDARAKSTLFPASDIGLSRPYQTLLFTISSTIPEQLIPLARGKGLQVQPGSRLLAINASATDLLRVLDFGSSASGLR